MQWKKTNGTRESAPKKDCMMVIAHEARVNSIDKAITYLLGDFRASNCSFYREGWRFDLMRPNVKYLVIPKYPFEEE
jgi:hypothetical protein